MNIDPKASVQTKQAEEICWKENFCCNGPCLDKKSVHVSEAHRKGLKKEPLQSVNPVVFDGTKSESGLRGGKNFAFPILDSGEENLTIKKQLDLEEEPRHSIESITELHDGSDLFVIVVKYLSPALHDIDQVGIMPDVQCTTEMLNSPQKGKSMASPLEADLCIMVAEHELDI